MNKYLIYGLVGLGLFATACSEKADVINNPDNEIKFDASVQDGVVLTKADAHSTTKLEMGFTVGLQNNSSSALKKQSTATYSSGTYTLSPAIYWDDLSNSTYDVRSNADVNIWAAQLAGRAESLISNKKIDWVIAADQTAGVASNDLLVADYIAQQKALSKDKSVNLCFHHTMTKVTINVVMGDGFASTEFGTAAATLLALNSKCTVDFTKAKGDGSDTDMITYPSTLTTSDIKMNRLATANTTATGIVVSFEAIVAPGTVLAKDREFATLVIGGTSNQNTYKVVLNDAVLTAWGKETSAANLTMKYSTHYVLNAKVSKGAVNFTASVNPWNNGGTAETVGEIHFSADAAGQPAQGSATTTAFEKNFKVYTTTNTAGTGYTAGSEFVYDSINNTFSTTSPMYWQSNSDNKFFRAALYENGDYATIASDKVSSLEACEYANTADLIWGTSGAAIYKPTVANVKMVFSHVLSQVSVQLKTTLDDSKIDLANVSSIKIVDTYTKGELGLHSGDITTTGTVADLTLAANTSTATAITTKTYLVMPQALSATSKIVVTMSDNSTFSADLTTIHKNTVANKGLGQTSAAWVKGNSYEYVITIKKSETTFSASLQKWADAQTGSGDATMDWD